jgi:hypothetical protein
MKNRQGLNRSLINLVIAITVLYIFGLTCIASAQMPEYNRLSPITENISAPTAVTVDDTGKIYVTESINNSLHIYSQRGEYVDTLTGLERPISVAVDSNGRIFIGNKDTGNVAVYDSDLTFLFKLGAGDGEFSQPNDIAIDTTGKIYVVDMGEDKVKVYNQDGSYNEGASFGSSGNGDGQFHKPLSIAIDESAGEIIVLDRQLTTDMYGGQIEGARIQKFNMDGSFKSSFSEYGEEIGQMFRPQYITVDGEGRIYVTDTYHNVVLVYDSSGTYLGAVYDLTDPLRTPLGIKIDEGNRLYIASLNTGRVEVYGIIPYTGMLVSPLSLSFEAQEGGSNPALQTVEITNNGTEILNWTADTQESWITLSATLGTVEVAGVATLEVGVNINGLSAGTYTGMVNIRAESGITEVIDITLTVSSMPVLSVTPGSLEFTSQNGSVPNPQDLTITNAGEGVLTWSAVADKDWIILEKTGGTAPDTVAVSVDITAKGVGVYTGSITVTGEGALSSPVVIPVTLNVEEVTGTIRVVTNLDEATYTINGPQSYAGAGKSWTVEGAPAGTYVIIYGEVDGYTAPASESGTLVADGTIVFNGEYTVNSGGDQTGGKKNIIVGAGPRQENAGVVKVYTADGVETTVGFIAHQYGYGVNVAAGDIDRDGYDEIITAPGPGAENPAEIRVFDRNGNELTDLRFTAYQYGYGANVASGDFNGDGKYEVIVGTGAGPDNPAYVKVYVYNEVQQVMEDSGINLLAYDNKLYGVKVAAGDIDYDGIDELITVPGPERRNRGIVKIWEVDTSSGAGQWKVSLLKEYVVTSRYGYSVNIASGDVNGDGYAEIITGAGASRRARDEIRIYDREGELIGKFMAHMVRSYGINIASGDIDNDGVAEIVAGAGPGPRNRAIVKVFNMDGVESVRFRALRMRYGVNVAIGDLGIE